MNNVKTTRTRNEFTAKEDQYLAQYLAKYNPDGKHREGNLLYKRLADNAEGHWPWAETHSWQSWRNHYVHNRAKLDAKIKHFLKTHAESNANNSNTGVNRKPGAPPPPPPPAPAPAPAPSFRKQYTDEEMDLLANYLAEENPDGKARQGMVLYEKLCSNPRKWPWAKNHSPQSWQDHVRRKLDWYTERVDEILSEKGVKGKRNRVRAASEERVPKRRRVVVESSSSSETEEESDQLTPSQYNAEPVAGPSRTPAIKKEEEESDDEVVEIVPAPARAQEDAGSVRGEVIQDEREETRVKVEVEGRIQVAMPPSDDYDGEVFADREEEDDISDSAEAAAMLVRPDSDEGDDKQPKSVKANGLHPKFRSPDSDLGYIDPPAAMPQASQPSRVMSPSQVLPSPETVRRKSLAQAPSQKVSQEPTPPTSNAVSPNGRAPSPISQPEPQPAAAVRKRKRRQVEVEFFGSPPVSEARTDGVARRARKPPTLVDGPHNHALSDRRGSASFERGSRRLSGVSKEPEWSSDEVEDTQWPPLRGRNKGKEKAVDAPEANEPRPERLAAEDKPAPPVPQKQQHHPFSQLSQEDSPIQPPPPPPPRLQPPSPRPNPAPAEHHPFSQPTQDTHTIRTTKTTIPLIPQNSKDRLAEALAKINAFRKAASPIPVAGPSKTEAAAPNIFIPQPSPLHHNEPVKASSPKRRPLDPLPPRSPARDLQLPPTPVPVDKGKQREMVPPPVPVPHGRRHTIDTSAPHDLARANSDEPADSRLPMYLYKGHEVSSEDQVAALRLGFPEALKRIAQNHKFHEEVAEEAWATVGSLKEADEMLRKMREAAQRCAEEIVQQKKRSSSGVGSDHGNRAQPFGGAESDGEH
ncbi:hypothetical protein BXZ70DRAFT_939114 [Cristinia sonorae]|uniref:TERF2-interacting telomeric protein 1 Myb domain-containing protein n=1 Tax=Cristinia sonorae TaxID=1940300 RepID=A0A8K0UPA7_9AGAR|nr:hypothetical protein BXZ70DRAFT_939114 [Cristinia sonorae]